MNKFIKADKMVDFLYGTLTVAINHCLLIMI